MKIFILADEDQKKEILSLHPDENDSITFDSTMPEDGSIKEHDVFFIFSDYEEIDPLKFTGKQVYFNEVIKTLSEFDFPGNFFRINGWPGFLERSIWEVASNQEYENQEIFNLFNRKVIFVKDEPGFVSARVISMIINEAFFALGEKVSTENEIDLAMKLGTNYPKGPFEWAQKIGIEKVYSLLKKLSEKEDRYIPAPALKKLYLEIKTTDL